MIHIIDDDQEICTVFSDIVRRNGFEVITFFSAQAYLEYMNGKHYYTPCAIFSDMNMPNMTGLDMIERVKRTHPNITCYIITGNPEQVNNEYLVNGTVRRVLEKPVHIGTLKVILESLHLTDSGITAAKC